MSLTHRSRNLDQEIDTALKLLSEAQPPAEMASRIHRKLKAAGAGPGRNRRGRLLLIPAGCVAAAVAVLLVLFAPWHGPRKTPAVENAKLEIAHPAPPPPASYEPKIATPENNSDRTVSKIRRSSHRRGHRGYRHAANLLNYPLTQQEKLLVEFAQNAKPEDLRYLNPEYQAKVEARQKTEFAAYLKSRDISSSREAAN